MSRLTNAIRALQGLPYEPEPEPPKPGVLATIQREAMPEVPNTVVVSRTNRLVFHGDASQFTTGGTPILQMARRLPGMTSYTGHINLDVFAILREAVPIMNAATSNRRTLEGRMVVRSQDEGLRRAIQEFWNWLPVGDAEGLQPKTGGQTALDAFADNIDTYGLGAGELILGQGGTVDRYHLPSPRSLFYDRNPITERYILKQRRRNGRVYPVDGQFVQVASFTFNPEHPWPYSLWWGLPFVGEFLIRMFLSGNNLWWRAGDPSSIYALSYDINDPTLQDGDLDTDADELENTLKRLLEFRRAGFAVDGVLATKGKVERITYGGGGDNGLAEYLREHYTTIAGQIVGRSETPIWMYPDLMQEGEGIGSSRSDNQSAIYTGAAESRNLIKERIARQIINSWLTLNGDVGQISRWEMEWEYPNIRDEQAWEQNRQTREQANAAAIENAQRLVDLGVQTEEQRMEYIQRAGVLPEGTPSPVPTRRN